MPVTWRGDRGGIARVAFTFDDGPHPSVTPRILDCLASEGIRAAFFVVGRNAESHPDLVRAIQDGGHLIGNHSYDHHAMGLFHGVEYWRRQLHLTDEVIEKITGEKPALFRPPMGFKHHRMAWALRATGHKVVTWSRRGFDGVNTSAVAITNRIVPSAVAGDILLLHDGAPPGSSFTPQATAEALPRIVDGLRARSLTFDRVDQLISGHGSETAGVHG